jgi:CheY-like chemotaxis protein
MIERARFEHAILNLAVNARDAMANHGRLTISISNVALDRPRVPELREERPYVQVVVSDTGIGMSEEVRARMFDRFFTTKGAESGSGLGLASIRTLINDSGGFIAVQSAVGEGTAITLYLPVAETGPASAPSLDRGAPGGSETVLVIDGDEAVRRAVRRVLEAGGYSVLAVDSEAAAVRAAAAARSVDLVLVDGAFPRIGERALRRRLLGGTGDVPCLVMCGRALGEHHDPSPAGERVLRKAFSSQELLHEIRVVLDAHRSGAAR